MCTGQPTGCRASIIGPVVWIQAGASVLKPVPVFASILPTLAGPAAEPDFTKNRRFSAKLLPWDELWGWVVPELYIVLYVEMETSPGGEESFATTRRPASAGWPGRARVVSSRLSCWGTLGSMRALHSPFDLLDHIHDLPML